MAKRKLPKPKPEAQYIYIASLFGYYKIGRTWNIDQRMKTLSATLLPEPLTVVFSGRVYSGKRVEKLLHDRYAGKRVRGEWFTLDSQDLAEIQAIIESKKESCACLPMYGGPPKMCAEAIRLRREMGRLTKVLPEDEFRKLPYVRHFLEL